MTLPRKCLGVLSATLVITLICAGCKLWSTSEELDPITVPFKVRLLHPGIDPKHPKEYTLNQVRDSSGLITGYTMLVDSVSCSEDVCQIALVTMSWDALGQYTGYTLKEGTALEKVATGEGKGDYKAVPFADADNTRLHEILKDKESILKTLNFRNLVAVRDGQKLDAVSGATPLSVQEAVVEGAALTCYHLWHWANGDVTPVTKDLTRKACNEKMLVAYLLTKKPHYAKFALAQLRERKSYNSTFIGPVNAVLTTGDQEQFDLAYAYLQAAVPKRKEFLDIMANEFQVTSLIGRLRLLERLESETDLPGTLLDKLGNAFPKMERYQEIHHLMNLFENRKHGSPSTIAQARRLLERKNFFIARRAYSYLKEQVVDAATQKRMDAFKAACNKQGRLL